VPSAARQTAVPRTAPDTLSIATIAGDGIGPEVIGAAVPVIQAAAAKSGVKLKWDHMPYGADHYLSTGETLPEAAYRRLSSDVDAILLGALGDPRLPDDDHARDILFGLRLRLDLFVNFRPCTLLHPDLYRLRPPSWEEDSGNGRAIDFVIFRENTEGIYLGRGSSRNEGTPDEEQVAEEVHTAPKVRRILEAAFMWAEEHGKTLVTMSDKSNAIPAHHLWRRLFDEVGEQFTGIQREHRYIDALAMEFLREPERFQVIVTNNLYGDILSDLGAQLVGGLGLAPSANLHPGRPGLFEPVHGSAPTLAGHGVANPMATILSGALMLADLGLEAAGDLLQEGVRAALGAHIVTPDLGGVGSTNEVADWIHRHISK
jgi:3-isopropylmalate dehydrogenase